MVRKTAGVLRIWVCFFNNILWTVAGVICIHTYIHTYMHTFNKQSGNCLVTSSSSTGWKDTVRGVDVGLVTERTKLTSCRGQETTQEVNYMGVWYR